MLVSLGENPNIPCILSDFKVIFSLSLFCFDFLTFVSPVVYSEDKLVHLDPHYCQMAAEPTEDQNFRDVDVKVSLVTLLLQ